MVETKKQDETKKNKLSQLLPITLVMGSLLLPVHADLYLDITEDSGMTTMRLHGSLDPFSMSNEDEFIENGLLLASDTGDTFLRLGFSGAYADPGPIGPTPGESSFFSEVENSSFTQNINMNFGISTSFNQIPGVYIDNGGFVVFPVSALSVGGANFSQTIQGSLADNGLPDGAFASLSWAYGEGLTESVVFGIGSSASGGGAVSPIPEVTGSSVLLGLFGLTLFGRRRQR